MPLANACGTGQHDATAVLLLRNITTACDWQYNETNRLWGGRWSIWVRCHDIASAFKMPCTVVFLAKFRRHVPACQSHSRSISLYVFLSALLLRWLSAVEPSLVLVDKCREGGGGGLGACLQYTGLERAEPTSEHDVSIRSVYAPTQPHQTRSSAVNPHHLEMNK